MPTICESKRQCWIPNRFFGFMYMSGWVLIAIMAAMSDRTGIGVEAIVSFCVAYFMLGGVILFSRMSILACPSKVLVVGVFFMFIASFLHVYIY